MASAVAIVGIARVSIGKILVKYIGAAFPSKTEAETQLARLAYFQEARAVQEAES